MSPYLKCAVAMKPHILVIDDSEELLEVFSFIFERHNLTVITADSKHSLNFQLNKINPDLILLDVLLHDGDGREICKELKCSETTKDTPVILMSATPKNLKNYKDYYADDIIEKPFEFPELIAKIKLYIR